MKLETARLILREFKRDDWKTVHEYAADPDVCKYMQWGPNSPSETVAFLNQALEHQREKPRSIFDFAVTLKESGRLIGAAGFRVHPALQEQAEMGYCYNKNYWRQGYAAEVGGELLNVGFGKYNLHRMFATCDAENLGSAGVLQKIGMRREGHFVQDKLIKGRWRDTLLFAILRNEWESRAHG